jgi:membrane dipeptidase
MNLPVFDGHNDVVLRIDEGRDFFEESSEGNIDLPRARRGGFAGGLFAVFVSGPRTEEPSEGPTGAYSLPLSPPVEYEEARSRADHLTGLLFGLERDGGFRIARTAREVEACFDEGTMAAVLHFEGAEAISDVAELARDYERGLRSLGLVWSRANNYAEGVPFRFPASPDTGPGLTSAGRELVRACNELGILVDLSHLNLRGFFEVAELSSAPLVASHSNVHALCPSTRNLTDEQLDAVAASRGIVGVNFAVAFLREDGQLERDTPLATVVDHVEYLVDRMGIDHVGLGSDYDGAAPPNELRDVTCLPTLFETLRGRGYDDEALMKIAHGNWIRVLRETWGG